MKCAYYCLLLGLLPSPAVYGQFYFSANNKTEPELLWELSVGAGAMNCLTDIGGSNAKNNRFIRDVNWNQTRTGAGIGLSATWHYLFTIRLEAVAGCITGTDQVLKNSTGDARHRYNRNLQFSTRIAELAMATELYPLLILNSNSEITALSPYLTAGMGLMHYVPRAWANEHWVDLRSLHTEGEGFTEYAGRQPYPPFTWCVPIGVGIKYDAARLVNLRLEILYRLTGSDYLDDASTRYIDPSLFSKYLSPAQSLLAAKLADRSEEIAAGNKNNINDIRGNPANKDAYFSFMLKASIALGRIQHK